MAFPTTSILDDFTGATEAPILANWTTPLTSGTGRSRRFNGTIQGMNDTAYHNAYYDLATYGPDCEAYAQVATKPPTADDYVSLWARVTDQGGAVVDGYELAVFTKAGTDTWQLYEVSNGTYNTMGAAFTTEIAVGDWIGLECIGDQISCYHKPSAGSWTLVGTRTDSTHSGAGYIGIEGRESTVGDSAMDNFGGGTVITGRTYKRLVGPVQLTGSAADLYTCPASTVTRILHIHASNPSASPVDINLSIGADAAATRIFDDYAVPADGVVRESYPYELAAGEKIQGWAASAGTVVLSITGIEHPA
jgi:hypothetical protein